MATIDAASVKKLRDATDAGMMECKKALVEAEGDFDKAVTILREKSLASAGKKAERATSEGQIGVHVSEDGKRAGIIEVNCETDFVARNEKFRDLVSDLAHHVEAHGLSDVEALLSQSFSKDASKTADQHLRESIATVGENIKVARASRIETTGELGAYTHSDGKQAAIVEITGSGDAEALKALARELAMQVVALRPQFVSRESIPADRLESERAIYKQQAAQEGKPEAIQEKIAEGRLGKEFLQAVSLLDQPSIREQKQTVAQQVKQLGGDARVVGFVRFKVGESA